MIIEGLKRFLNKNAEKLFDKFSVTDKKSNKYDEEELFWSNLIDELVLWFNGEIKERSQTLSPENDQKIQCPSIEDSAILTWFELHQKPKYSNDLQLPADAFRGMSPFLPTFMEFYQFLWSDIL